MEYRRKVDISILPTILLLIILGVGFGIGAKRITSIAIENSLEYLKESTSQFALFIRSSLDSDKEQLELISNILGVHDTITPVVAEKMTGIEQNGAYSAVYIFTPDNKVYFYKDDGYEVLESEYDFEKEAAKGQYVSEVIHSKDGEKYFCQSVLIQKDGEIKGIVYGVTDLNKFPSMISTKVFEGQAKLYIADGESGDFIVSEWNNHKNLYDGSLGTQTLKEQYDYELWLDNLKNGREDCIAAYSENTDEYFYTAAQPVGINQWMVMLSVPEKVVFHRVIHVYHVLMFLAVLDAILMIVYLVWVIVKVRKEVGRDERRIRRMTYMYEVQKTLFDSHRSSDRVTEGLSKTGKVMTASLTFLCPLENGEITKIYQWPKEKDNDAAAAQKRNMRRAVESARDRLAKGESVLCDMRDKGTEIAGWDFREMKEDGITNMMLVPLLDLNDTFIGVLGAMNMKTHWRETTLLECTSWNFMMALSNIESYDIIHKMGTMDALTGLKNRNSFEKRLSEYNEKEEAGSCCIYMDADGLHELNNTLGHAAGDEMLRTIADKIIKLFGVENAYRIGGDEYVVFEKNCSKEDIKAKITQLQNELQKNNYHMSIGAAWNDGSRNSKQIILDAEQDMYEAKRKYYAENESADRRGKSR